MDAAVLKNEKKAIMQFDLNSEDDRQTFIAWLQQLKAKTPEDQMQIDKCILAAGGTPTTFFPGYEWIQQ